MIETSYQVAQTLVHELEKGQKNNFSVAIGPVAERISELPASFEITQMILETASSLKEQIISYEDLIQEAKLPVDSVFYFDLSLDLSSLSKNEVSKYIEHLTKPQGTPTRTRLYRLFVLTKLLQHVCLKEKKIPQEMVHCTSTSQRLAISTDDSLYRSTVYMFISFLTALPSQPSRNKYQPILNHALDFIKENFTDPDISLTWVAQQVALSPSHFSTIFSQSFNQTFIDYLTEQRIELAKNYCSNQTIVFQILLLKLVIMTLTISVIYLRKNKGFLQKNIGHNFSLKTKITNKRNPYNDTLSICN